MESIQVKQENEIKVEQNEIFYYENDMTDYKQQDYKPFEDSGVELELDILKQEINFPDTVVEINHNTISHTECEIITNSSPKKPPSRKSNKSTKRKKTSKCLKSEDDLDTHNLDKTPRDCLRTKNNIAKTAGEKFKCPYCDITASFMGNLKRHIREIHVKQKIFKCKDCDYVSTRKSHLNIHINTKHTKEKKYRCTFCDFEALSPNTLRNHLNHIHTLHRWYNCKLCEFKTTHSGNLKVHIEGKHNETKDKWKCKHCDSMFDKKFHLNKHMDQVHEREKLECPFCNHVCKVRSRLGKHIMKKHPEKAKYRCETCDYRGMNELNLKNHIVSTHQYQSITCPDCDASFDCFASLKKHSNIKHT